MRSLQLNGHIGSKVSALVDGQLTPEDEERAWSHVLGCPGCRRLVESEGWTKTQLRACAPVRQDAPASLVGALYAVEAWAQVDEIERESRRRFAATALVGVGSLGVALLGIVGLTSSPAGLVDAPGTPSPATIHTEQVSSVVGAGVGAALLTAHVQQRRAASTTHARHSQAPVPAAPSPALVGNTAR